MEFLLDQSARQKIIIQDKDGNKAYVFEFPGGSTLEELKAVTEKLVAKIDEAIISKAEEAEKENKESTSKNSEG